MKIYIYKEVKFSLLYSESFTGEGLIQAKKTVDNMLSKGLDPKSMHLLFCREGLLCPDSRAKDHVLVIRETSSGEGKFWISKKNKKNNYIVTVTLMGLFIIAIMSQFR